MPPPMPPQAACGAKPSAAGDASERLAALRQRVAVRASLASTLCGLGAVGKARCAWNYESSRCVSAALGSAGDSAAAEMEKRSPQRLSGML